MTSVLVVWTSGIDDVISGAVCIPPNGAAARIGGGVLEILNFISFKI